MSLDLILFYCALILILATSVYMSKNNNLIAVVFASSILSLFSAMFYIFADAVDVALTESAVGVGISTILFLITILIASDSAKPSKLSQKAVALVATAIFAALLLYGASEMQPLFDINNITNTNVVPRYISETPEFFHIPNIVTAVLGSYRGFDTMGETVVIFVATVGVISILSKGEINDK